MDGLLRLLFEDHRHQLFGTAVKEARCDQCGQAFSFAATVDHLAHLQISRFEDSAKAAAEAEQMAERGVGRAVELMRCREPCPHCHCPPKCAPPTTGGRWRSPWMEAIQSALLLVVHFELGLLCFFALIYLFVVIAAPAATGRPGLEQMMVSLLYGLVIAGSPAAVNWLCFKHRSGAATSACPEPSLTTHRRPIEQIPTTEIARMVRHARLQHFHATIAEAAQELREWITVALVGVPVFCGTLIWTQQLPANGVLVMVIAWLATILMVTTMHCYQLLQLTMPRGTRRAEYQSAMGLAPGDLASLDTPRG